MQTSTQLSSTVGNQIYHVCFLAHETAGLIIDSLEMLYQMNMFSHILSNNVLRAVTWIHLDTKMSQRYSDKSVAQKVFTKAFIRALIYRMQPFKSHSLVVNLTYSPAVYPSKTATVLGVTYLIIQQFNWSFLSYFSMIPETSVTGGICATIVDEADI